MVDVRTAVEGVPRDFGEKPGYAALASAPIVSWALYDFANTIFSYAVITRYFNEWITIQRDKPDLYVGFMNFIVGVGLVLTLPPAGALADRFGRRKPFLVAFTLLCVAMTALLGVVDSTTFALVLAGVAIFAFQSALIHYDPLLADVAPESIRGRVSGFGVGLGYVGVLLALVVLGLFVPEDDNQRAFLPTAAMFLLFALPCFLLVRESSSRAGRASRDTPGAVARQALTQLRQTLRNARRYSDVGRFLLARFLYVDAVATVIAFMTVYAERVGLSGAAKTALLGVSVSFAAVGSLVAGAIVERIGPKRTLISILSAFVAGLVATAASGSAAILWVSGPLVGVALGTVWTSDRVFMLRLSPPRYLGEFFGLYGLAGKLASGFGPLVIWGGTLWLLTQVTDLAGETAASRVAIVGLALACAAGILTLRPLSDAQRVWRSETE